MMVQLFPFVSTLKINYGTTILFWEYLTKQNDGTTIRFCEYSNQTDGIIILFCVYFK